MREICTSGSVGGEGGNILAYPATKPIIHIAAHWLRTGRLDTANKIGQIPRMAAMFRKFHHPTTIFLWLVGTLVLAELVSRLVSGVFVLSFDNLVARELSPLRWAGGPLLYDDKLGWRLKPRGQYAGQGRPDGKLSIGALGLRGAPYDTRRVPRQAILAVGETVTLGVNIDDGETWPAQLAALLQEPVLNGATWSWGLDQIVLRAKELMPLLRPKALLVTLRPESVAETNYKTFGLGYKPYFDIVDEKLHLAGVPVPKMGEDSRDIGRPQSFLGYSHLVNTFMRTAVGSWLSRSLLQTEWVDHAHLIQRAHVIDKSDEIACVLMEHLAELKDHYGTRVVVMMVYSEGELRAPRSADQVPSVLVCARDRGLDTLDSYWAMNALAASDRARYRQLWQGQGDSYGCATADGNGFVAALVHEAVAATPAETRALEPGVQAK
jgi:hypothetical protein